jgi:hypothetical protein
MGIWFARVNVCGWVHARYEPKMIHTDWCNGSGWHMPKLIRYVGLIDSCSLRRETWLAWYSSTWKLIFIWAEKPWFLYTLLVWTIICCIYIESSWCHVLTIQTLPKVFLIYGDFVFHFSSIPWLKINQSSQSTTKVRQYKDGHVSTCVLGNEPNLLPPPQPPLPLHMGVLSPKDAWRYRQNLHQRQRTLFCFTKTIGTWKCALTWARLIWGQFN